MKKVFDIFYFEISDKNQKSISDILRFFGFLDFPGRFSEICLQLRKMIMCPPKYI